MEWFYLTDTINVFEVVYAGLAFTGVLISAGTLSAARRALAYRRRTRRNGLVTAMTLSNARTETCRLVAQLCLLGVGVNGFVTRGVWSPNLVVHHALMTVVTLAVLLTSIIAWQVRVQAARAEQAWREEG